MIRIYKYLFVSITITTADKQSKKKKRKSVGQVIEHHWTRIIDRNIHAQHYFLLQLNAINFVDFFIGFIVAWLNALHHFSVHILPFLFSILFSFWNTNHNQKDFIHKPKKKMNKRAVFVIFSTLFMHPKGNNINNKKSISNCSRVAINSPLIDIHEYCILILYVVWNRKRKLGRKCLRCVLCE